MGNATCQLSTVYMLALDRATILASHFNTIDVTVFGWNQLRQQPLASVYPQSVAVRIRWSAAYFIGNGNNIFRYRITLKISRTTLYRYVSLADATPADPGNATD